MDNRTKKALTVIGFLAFFTIGWIAASTSGIWKIKPIPPCQPIDKECLACAVKIKEINRIIWGIDKKSSRD